MSMTRKDYQIIAKGLANLPPALVEGFGKIDAQSILNIVVTTLADSLGEEFSNFDRKIFISTVFSKD